MVLVQEARYHQTVPVTLKSIKQNEKVTVTVLKEIQDAMLRGELKRGDRLPSEPELASMLGVSRPAIREALKVLEALSVVDVKRGNGTFIHEQPELPQVNPLLFLLLLQDGTARDLVELRFLMEFGSARILQQRLSPEIVTRLRQHIESLERAYASNTLEVEHDLGFHRIILESTGNPFLIQIGTVVLEMVKQYVDIGVHNFPEMAIKHHKEILEALESGDLAALETANLHSYEGFWRALRGGDKPPPVAAENETRVEIPAA
jgi:GntR family transcriptional repressor for pyruvate dehydrogenase complex